MYLKQRCLKRAEVFVYRVNFSNVPNSENALTCCCTLVCLLEKCQVWNGVYFGDNVCLVQSINQC